MNIFPHALITANNAQEHAMCTTKATYVANLLTIGLTIRLAPTLGPLTRPRANFCYRPEILHYHRKMAVYWMSELEIVLANVTGFISTCHISE